MVAVVGIEPTLFLVMSQASSARTLHCDKIPIARDITTLDPIVHDYKIADPAVGAWSSVTQWTQPIDHEFYGESSR